MLLGFSCTSTKRSNHSRISNFCAIIFELMTVVLASSWICRHFPSLNGYCPCAVKWMSDRWRCHSIFSKRIGVPWVLRSVHSHYRCSDWTWVVLDQQFELSLHYEFSLHMCVTPELSLSGEGDFVDYSVVANVMMPQTMHWFWRGKREGPNCGWYWCG